MENTEFHKPPMEMSDEADAQGLILAKKQGEAMLETVKYMTEKIAKGRTKPAGNYIVGYAIEEAEGMYSLYNEKLIWHEPTDENAHIEIVVADGADMRFIPMLNVTVTVLDKDRKEIGKHNQPFLWHPYLYHYGRNWKLPGDGIYTLRVEIDPPQFMRHDKKNGRRYAERVTVEFSEVEIETGQDKS